MSEQLDYLNQHSEEAKDQLLKKDAELKTAVDLNREYQKYIAVLEKKLSDSRRLSRSNSNDRNSGPRPSPAKLPELHPYINATPEPKRTTFEQLDISNRESTPATNSRPHIALQDQTYEDWASS